MIRKGATNIGCHCLPTYIHSTVTFQDPQQLVLSLYLNQLCLEFSGKHGTGRILLPYLLQPLVVLKEEPEVHEGNVNLTVTAFLSMLLQGVPTPGESVFIDLLEDGTSVCQMPVLVDEKLGRVQCKDNGH